jgi:hypothetical protein
MSARSLSFDEIAAVTDAPTEEGYANACNNVRSTSVCVTSTL